MKRLLLLSALFFMQPQNSFCEPSTEVSLTLNKADSESSDSETKPPQLNDEERDAMLIISGMGILGAVVSIFVDRYNMPHVKTQLFAALASLQQFVSYMVRSPLSAEQEEQIVEQLLEYLEQLWMLEQKEHALP